MPDISGLGTATILNTKIGEVDKKYCPYWFSRENRL